MLRLGKHKVIDSILVDTSIRSAGSIRFWLGRLVDASPPDIIRSAGSIRFWLDRLVDACLLSPPPPDICEKVLSVYTQVVLDQIPTTPLHPCANRFLWRALGLEGVCAKIVGLMELGGNSKQCSAQATQLADKLQKVFDLWDMPRPSSFPALTSYLRRAKLLGDCKPTAPSYAFPLI